MKLNSSRFGTIEIDSAEVINFPEGLLGFDQENQFYMINPSDGTYLLWLQSVKSPNVCFPLLEPGFFIQNFTPTLLPADLRNLGIEKTSEVIFYTIVTIPDNLQEISANLKAPITINHKTKVAKQVVLQDNKLDVSFPIYTEFKRTLMQLKNKDIKEDLTNLIEDRSQNISPSL